MKKCTKCGALKEVSEFEKDISKKIGLKARCRSCVAEYRNGRRVENAKKCAEWRKNNPEKFKVSVDSWRQRNIEARRAQWRNRKARLRAADGHHSAADIADLIKAQRNRCAVCKSVLTHLYHVDHIQAISRGGGNSRSNLQILCRSCNCRKSNKSPEQFMREQGLLL